MLTKVLIYSSTMFAVLSACQPSKFKGYNGGAKSEAPTTPTQQPTQPQQTVTPQPTTVVTNPPPSNPNPNPTLTPPPPTVLNPDFGLNIEFSKPNQNWHLGNNDFADTTCKIRVTLNRIDGVRASFNFEVVEDSTVIQSIVVGHCGVAGTNGNDFFDGKIPVNLQDSAGANLVPTTFLRTSGGIIFTDAALQGASGKVLNRGKYGVVVNTIMNPSNQDLDDFLIGKVRINANKPVRKLDVQLFAN